MAAAPLPADPAGWLYRGLVMHHRLRPRRHRFVYQVFTLLLDIDRLAELDRGLRLLAVDRPNLFSVRQADHGARDGSPLRPWVERQLGRHGLAPGGRILLLAMPRQLGYVFNPLSIYYCHDRDGRLQAVVYEVKNTFGEQHAYVLPVAADRRIRQSCAKQMYVSPFIEADARYHFRLEPPGERLSVVIQEEVGAAPLLVASLTGARRPLTDLELAKAALTLPLMTFKVISAIHYEALKLWLKRIALQPRAIPGVIEPERRAAQVIGEADHGP
jgi:hypothetical protein